MNAWDCLTDVVNFARDHAGWGIALAGVLHAWILARSKRRIVVTRRDGTTVSTEGLNTKNFATVLRQSNSPAKLAARVPLGKRGKGKG